MCLVISAEILDIFSPDVHVINVPRCSQGRQVTYVELLKPVSGGLGFSVVGLRSENRGELGIFIQEIQRGSVAHWYGRASYASVRKYAYIQYISIYI